MDGSGAWVKQSQPEQAIRGRTMRFTADFGRTGQRFR